MPFSICFHRFYTRTSLRIAVLSLGFVALTTDASPQAAPAVQPAITSVNIFQQAGADSTQQTFIIEIKGTGLDAKDLRAMVFPATSIRELIALPVSAAEAPTTMRIRFTGPQNYMPEEVAVSLPNSEWKVKSTGKTPCDYQQDVKPIFNVVPNDQAKDKYGNGIAANFYVVQLSILNGCSSAVTVPLAGIKILPKTVGPSNPIAPASLDHVTSLYSSDRKLTGTRAIFFNILQAAATVGSAIQPFFGPGFAQGVAIWGGGFTQGWQTVFRDMSAEQLQNLTSQSLGSNEKIAANGPLQKFIFVPSQCGGPTFVHHWKKKKCRNTAIEEALMSGAFDIDLQFVPVSAQAATVKAMSAKAPIAPK